MRGTSIFRIIGPAFLFAGCQSHLSDKSLEQQDRTTSQQIKSSVNKEFDPYGYYIFRENVKAGHQKIEWLFITNRIDTPTLRITDTKTGIFKDVNAKKFSIEGSKPYLEFELPGKIPLIFKGEFAGKQKPSTDEIVLQGTLSINGTQNPVSLTCFEGD